MSFDDDLPHERVETATHFHLSDSRAKSIERTALHSIREELHHFIGSETCDFSHGRRTVPLYCAGILSVIMDCISQRSHSVNKTVSIHTDCSSTLVEPFSLPDTVELEDLTAHQTDGAALYYYLCKKYNDCRNNGKSYKPVLL